MKKIEMLFYKTDPSMENIGFKFVLIEILIENQGKEPDIKYDWGFCEWQGTEWGPIDTPEGVTAVVHMWANTVNPDIILNDTRILRV